MVTFNGSAWLSPSDSSPQYAYRIEAGNYIIVSTDHFIESTGSGSTITLPTPVGIQGKPFVVINASGGNITVDTAAGNINGSASVTLIDEESMSVISNNTNYKIY